VVDGGGDAAPVLCREVVRGLCGMEKGRLRFDIVICLPLFPLNTVFVGV
jgi:hypothetical protein